jgi:acetylornithine deacetylase/succinyl-diaminopimelate desuccinylase-like protein
MRATTLISLFSLVCPMNLVAQTKYPTKFSPELSQLPVVSDALAYVDDNFERQVGEWMHITQIPAPSGNEGERGVYVRTQLGQLGLEVTTDSIGNVIGRRPGTGGGETLVFAAHMDTVHPLGTDLTVTRETGRLHAPGVYDNSASVANMLAAARAIQSAGLVTKGDVIFIATVREEVGLDGMSYWLDHNPDVTDMLVALDGGLGPISYGALGIYWSSMEFSAEGSHTLSSRGKPHPARAASHCILNIYDIPLPSRDAPASAVYNVGMLRGGHVVNAIPQEVSFTVDLRTVDPVLLAELDSAILEACETAASDEGVEFRREWISKSEAGGRPDQLADRRAHPLVQTAVDVLEHLGYDFGGRPSAVASGSTDANTAVIRGIPAISTGRTRGGNQHTVTEWADIEPARIGTKQIILLTAALAEVVGGA